jgi:penicillin amidase
VREVLCESRQFSVDDFGKLQHDDKSLVAAVLVPALRGAAERAGVAGTPYVQALLSWDLRMSRTQVAPTIFSVWAPALFKRAITRAVPVTGPIGAILAQRPSYAWLEGYLSRTQGSAETDSMVLGALADAEKQLGAITGGVDTLALTWGTVHTARFRHPLSAKYDLPPASRSGDGNTVNVTGGAGFTQTAGASFREVIDLADFDRSIVTNVPGQSADPRSPHYADLLPLWASDRYFPLVYSRARVEEETERVTWLRPRTGTR